MSQHFKVRSEAPQPESTFNRATMRRNYRWMREGGVSPTVARIVLRSTFDAGKLDKLYADLDRKIISGEIKVAS